MTFISKKERLFQLPNSILCQERRSAGRLKEFASVLDRRSWGLDEEDRTRHLLETMTQSRTCLEQQESRSVIKPASDRSLRDNIITKLQQKLKSCNSKEDVDSRGQTAEEADVLFRNKQFRSEDTSSDVQDLIRLVEAKEDQLAECRQTLWQVMQKLEAIDDIVNQNETLTKKLKCSEEEIQSLHQQLLEMTHSQSQIELLRKKSAQDLDIVTKENECYKNKLKAMRSLEVQVGDLKKRAEELTDKYRKESIKSQEQLRKMSVSSKEMDLLKEERDRLHSRVDELAGYEAQYNVLQRKLHTVESIIAENEVLNAKLGELDRMEIENQTLRAKLEKLRLVEAGAFEDKERIIQLQLAVADQEEEMRRLLIQIEKLAKRNSDPCLCTETPKKYPCKGVQVSMKCCCPPLPAPQPCTCEPLPPVVDEEEIKRLRLELEDKETRLTQIEKGRDDLEVAAALSEQLRTEVENLKTELKAKAEQFKEQAIQLREAESKLVLCEEQLAELPYMEAEIDELKKTLTKSIEDTKNEQEDRQSEREPSIMASEYEEGIDQRRRNAVVLTDNTEYATALLHELECADRSTTCQGVQTLLATSKQIISCILGDVDEHHKEMELFQRLSHDMKEEITMLRTRLGKADCQTAELNCLKQLLEGKQCLQNQLEGEMTRLRAANCELQGQLVKNQECCERLKAMQAQVCAERKARLCAEQLAKQLEEKRVKETDDRRTAEELSAELNAAVQRETELLQKIADLETAIENLQKLVNELKEENELLRNAQTPSQDFSKELEDNKELKKLLGKLEGEMDSLKASSDGKADESAALQAEVKRLLQQIDDLKTTIADLQGQLVGVRGSKGKLEDELGRLTSELARMHADDESEAMRSDIDQKDKEIARLMADVQALKKTSEDRQGDSAELEKQVETHLKDIEACHNEKTELLDELNSIRKDIDACQKERTDLQKELEGLRKDMKVRQDEGAELQTANDELLAEIERLKNKSEELEGEVNNQKSEISRLNEEIQNKDRIAEELREKMNSLLEDLEKCQTEAAIKEKQITEMEGMIAEKDGTIGGLTEEMKSLQDEFEKVRSETDVLKNRLKEVEDSAVPRLDYEKDLADKLALEQAMNKLVEDTDLMRNKLASAEEGNKELAEIKAERDELINRIRELEKEIGSLNDRLSDKESEFKATKKELGKVKAALEERVASGVDEERLLEEIVGLREKIASCHDENKRLKSELENLTSEVGKLNKQLAEVAEVGIVELEQATQRQVSEGYLVEEARGIMSEGSVAYTQHPQGPQTKGVEETGRKQGMIMRGAVRRTCSPIPESKESSIVSFRHLDPSFEQFTTLLSMEEHKENIASIEERYAKKLKQLEAENAGKMRKMIEQHEKEKKQQNMTYNDNMNRMRSGYETDMKKLSGKHRDSILQLQALHEDEVQELNTNYETQMEAMQTQNESVVSDLTLGAAGKMKELRNQHVEDLRGLETKFQQLIDEKEAHHVLEVSALEKNITDNIGEVEDLHKKTLDNMSDTLKCNVEQMKAKHVKELKRVKHGNSKRMNVMKSKYEELLTEERKKYEAQMEQLLAKLRAQGSDAGLDECECEFLGFKSKPCQPVGPLDFHQVLRKILAHGIDSLTFNEVVLVHRKTCFAIEGIMMDPEMTADLEPGVGSECPHVPLLKADKEQLLHRIFVLENEIAVKQLETHEAIVNMELQIKAERRKLQDLRCCLRNEHERNSELQVMLTTQSREQIDLQVERDLLGRQACSHEARLISIVKELERERQANRCLQEELQKEKTSLRHLRTAIEPERDILQDHRQRDTNYVKMTKERENQEQCCGRPSRT